MTRLAALDIGGTHARFAIAHVVDGQVQGLEQEARWRVRDHADLPAAWAAYKETLDGPAPRMAGIAVAGKIRKDMVHLTNNPWVIYPHRIADDLGLERHVLINDFEAVGHSVAQSGPEHFKNLCGPDVPLPSEGIISIVGPGTGLGVACVRRTNGVTYVHSAEGAHADFAPQDAIEDAIVARLRRKYHNHVSVERVVSGPGIVHIYAVLAEMAGRDPLEYDDKMIWQHGMDGEDLLAVTAIERFCMSLGSVAGNCVLTQGANSAVIAGGLGIRVGDILMRSSFAERFRSKGRLEAHMATLPVKLITIPEPGLFGAAAAFTRKYPCPE